MDLKLAELHLKFVVSSGIAENLIISPKASLYDPHYRESFGITLTSALSRMKSNAHPVHGLAVRVTYKPTMSPAR